MAPDVGLGGICAGQRAGSCRLHDGGCRRAQSPCAPNVPHAGRPGRATDPMAEQWRTAVEPVKVALTAVVMWRYTECAP